MATYRGPVQYGSVTAHQFELDDGSPFVTEDPALAAQLGGADFYAPQQAQQLAPAPQGNPMAAATAQNAGGAAAPFFEDPVAQGDGSYFGPPPTTTDVGPQMSEDPSQMMSVDPAAQQTNMDAMPPEPQQAPAQQGAPPPQVTLSPEQIALTQVNPYKYVAGQQAGWVDKTATRKGPQGERNALAGSIQELAKSRYETATERAKAEAAMLQRDQAAAVAQQGALQEEIQQQQARVADLQAYKDKRVAELDQKAQEVKSQAVDPKRWFRDASPGVTLLSILSLGLGEFGASLTGRQNTAMQMINSYVDADIAQQQAQIDASKEAFSAEQNAFARELAEGKDPEVAKLELKVLQREYLASQLQQRDTQDALALLGVNTQDVYNQIQQQNIEDMLKLNDHYTVQYNQQYQQGRRGGVVEKTPEERLREAQALAALGYMAAGQSPDAGTRLAERKLAQQETGGVGSEVAKDVAAYNKELQSSNIPATEAQITDMYSILDTMEREGIGEIPTPETRNVASRAFRSAEQSLRGERPSVLDSEAEVQLLGQFAELRNKAKNMLYGAAVSEQENKGFLEQLRGVNTVAGMRRWIQQVERAAKAKKSAIAAGHSPQAVKIYEERNAAYQRRSDPNADVGYREE